MSGPTPTDVPLLAGARGAYVAQLQQLLQDQGGDIQVTGIVDQPTIDAANDLKTSLQTCPVPEARYIAAGLMESFSCGQLTQKYQAAIDQVSTFVGSDTSQAQPIQATTVITMGPNEARSTARRYGLR